ncbi:MAG: succinate dehydrogenase assembly factor 2 [Wenzhouxiangellaceae bacterium]
MSDLERERARLRWRCRRGMRELDSLLERWLERHFDDAGADLRATFERLLDCEDDRLWAWATGRSRSDDPALAALMDQIVEP